VLRVVVLDQVLQDATRLEDINLLAIGESISYGRNTPIWVDLKEPWIFLLVLAELDLLDFVGEAAR
jgi:hypothetical protein